MRYSCERACKRLYTRWCCGARCSSCTCVRIRWLSGCSELAADSIADAHDSGLFIRPSWWLSPALNPCYLEEKGAMLWEISGSEGVCRRSCWEQIRPPIGLRLWHLDVRCGDHIRLDDKYVGAALKAASEMHSEVHGTSICAWHIELGWCARANGSDMQVKKTEESFAKDWKTPAPREIAVVTIACWRSDMRTCMPERKRPTDGQKWIVASQKAGANVPPNQNGRACRPNVWPILLHLSAIPLVIVSFQLLIAGLAPRIFYIFSPFSKGGVGGCQRGGKYL